MGTRHSILIIVHRDPQQVRRLVERLRHPRVDLWLHVDAKVDAAPYLLEGVRLVRPRLAVDWAGFSCVAATLSWLRASATGDASTFTLLTGQDYPLRPIEAIVESLEADTAGRMDFSTSGEDRRWRYRTLWLHPRELGSLHGVAMRIARALWHRDRSCRDLPRGLDFASGSAYWTLRAAEARWVLSFLGNRPEVERFFRHTFAPDEMFFHSILAASPFRRELQPPLRHIDWSAGGSHPRTLGVQDFEALCASTALFARKFPADDPVLDLIDRELLAVPVAA